MTKIIDCCLEVATLFKVSTSFQDYDYLVSVLDQLLDIVESNSEHPLWNLIDVIAERIRVFDEEHFNFDD